MMTDGAVNILLLVLREYSGIPECRGNATQQRRTETDCLTVLEALISTLNIYPVTET